MVETMDTNLALDEADKLSKEMDQFYRQLQSLIVKKSSSLDLKRERREHMRRFYLDVA